VALSQPGRTVRLPYHYGDTVYLTGREDHVPGIVIGYEILPGALKAQVRWTDYAFTPVEHFLCELTTEYEPQFASRSRD
jgi:hypothetical protein